MAMKGRCQIENTLSSRAGFMVWLMYDCFFNQKREFHMSIRFVALILVWFPLIVFSAQPIGEAKQDMVPFELLNKLPVSIEYSLGTNENPPVPRFTEVKAGEKSKQEMVDSKEIPMILIREKD